jgi:hypothetical protein
MSDAPDPLGKRALYWAPAERYEDGPRNADEAYVEGKHALFSDARPGPAAPDAPAGDVAAGISRGAKGKTGHPSNGRPPGDGPASARHERYRGSRPDDLERPSGSGMFGTFTLHCSSCRVRSHVDVVEYVVLHLPLWFWRPGRGYTRFMSCPSCHRRTWVSASWEGWSR